MTLSQLPGGSGEMHIKTSDQPIMTLGVGDYQCNWGLHVAGLYETDEQRDEIIFGFFNRGARDGDLQLYCPTERSEEDFRLQFSRQFPDLSDSLDSTGSFQFFSTNDLYFPNGVFSPKAMDIGLNAFFDESQSNGSRNIRASAEMVWALEAIPGREHLFAYESRLNYFIPGKPWVSICMYNIKKFSGALIMRVLQTHPYTISSAGITENPYYQDPNDWLRENAPEFLPENMEQ